MNLVTARYDMTDIYISETGVMDVNDGVRDKLRVEWIREHANEILKGLFRFHATILFAGSLFCLTFSVLIYFLKLALSQVTKTCKSKYKEIQASRKHTYIILTPLNLTFIK